MERDLQAEWDKLCEQLQVAQGEYMELHGELVRKATGGAPRTEPAAGDFKRAEEARSRVDRIQKDMDDFVSLHCR